MFSGFSNIIQNDLIAAIGDAVRYDIKEISATQDRNQGGAGGAKPP